MLQTSLHYTRKQIGTQAPQNPLQMKTLGDQTREFREARGWNAGEMARAVGTSRQNIESLEAHGNRVPKYLADLAKVMGTTVDQMLEEAGLSKLGGTSQRLRLVSGTGEQANRHGMGTNAASLPSGGLPDSDDEQTIPQYDVRGSMGVGVLLQDQPGIIKSWRVTPEWIQKNVHNVTSAKNLAIVTGFGDSMKPMFNPGDPLLVDTGVKAVEYDAVYFFRIGSEGFIKRLQRIPGIGLRAISENRAYEPWDITQGMDFEVFARVVKVWRSEDF